MELVIACRKDCNNGIVIEFEFTTVIFESVTSAKLPADRRSEREIKTSENSGTT